MCLELPPRIIFCWISVCVAHPDVPHSPSLVGHLDLLHAAHHLHHPGELLLLQLMSNGLAEDQQLGMVCAALLIVGERHGGVGGGVGEDGAHRGAHGCEILGGSCMEEP